MTRVIANLSVLLFLVAPVAEAGLNEELSRIVTERAVKAVEKPIPIKSDTFKGTLSADNPQENVKVTIDEFSLANDTITLDATATARLALKGKLGIDDDATDVAAKLDVTVSIKTKFRLFEEDGKFYVEATVKDLTLDLKVLELSPENLSGGTTLISKLVNAAFKSRKQDIIDDLNEKYHRIEINL